ncbi:crotonase/enoyl-CoA hydratase family protein [Aurantimonas sp. C2-6-R+9]|uniref:crotonase/enoyl-CoA hydratase family protein n=1 Tax=unclassified Aurantimonas TaxID=2638230 RepID=UPI002E177A66|nr:MULTISPECIES: crotonase/enoyl-CoA hydratase family protein [unclassified Aurantimonas]MEC5289969.1 crotonase/enoyl-CoA hydratase family protein [Aurantimonas sp. C2-3-R2]MEC5381191.1 crotonase/enoyl-CoA hydratase family protein [Aurantimonas sp. C2-6-R+9]MEC5411034.1 crotonase/enoyl-CoA hydratase family protein [Aurantimonas sp. C2-4-R8]
MTGKIRIETDGRGVATLTLARPDKHNAMNAAMIADLTRAAEEFGADPTVRVVVLTGEGRSFSAGADLAWMKAQFAASREERIAEATALARMLKALNEMPKPLIGRIQGQAFGGGLGLIAVCDVAVASDAARFAFTEAKLGLIPATISPYVLARMGEGRARRVFMSARLFDADEAVSLGLLAQAIPADDLDAAVEAEIAPYLACSPAAVAASKALARSLGPIIDEATIADTARRLADIWETADAREGVGAFFDKRLAAFVAAGDEG